MLAARQALTSCDVLIKENIDIPGHLAQDIINNRSTKTQWQKFLNKEDLAFIKTLFSTSPTDFNKMTATEMYVFLNRYFNQHVCLALDYNDNYQTLDDYIGTRAREQNLELVGLETTEEQIELINKDVEGMPRNVHKKRLSQIIAKIRNNDGSECEETDWYAQRQFDYLFDQPCTNSLMLTDRNNKWLVEIIPHLNSANCFIAVGLSHLMYECGLINQLRKHGYTVTPVAINQAR